MSIENRWFSSCYFIAFFKRRKNVKKTILKHCYDIFVWTEICEDFSALFLFPVNTILLIYLQKKSGKHFVLKIEIILIINKPQEDGSCLQFCEFNEVCGEARLHAQ